jgi:hypothetical protein
VPVQAFDSRSEGQEGHAVNPRFLFVIALLGLAACEHGGSVRKPRPATVMRPAAPATPARSIAELVPADTAILVRMDVRQLLASSMWQRFGGQLLATPEVTEITTFLNTRCHIDVLTDVSEIALSAPASLAPESIVFYVRGRLGEDKVAGCLRAVFRESGRREPVIATRDHVTRVDVGTRVAYFGWPAEDTLAFVPAGIDGDASALGWIHGRKAAPAVGAVAGKLAPEQVVSGGLVVVGKLSGELHLGDLEPQAMWLNLAQRRGLSLEVGLRYPDDTAARQASASMEPAIMSLVADPTYAPFTRDLHVRAIGRETVLTWRLDEPAFDELVTALAPAFPELWEAIVAAARQ